MRAVRFVLTTALIVGAALSLAGAARAAVHHLVLGPGYAAASGATASSARAFTGAGSFYELYPSSKTEFYLDVATQLGGAFTVDQIASISYHTVNGATNPSGVDFFAVLYTQPFVGGDASWYGRRVNSEPYLTNGYVPPTAWNWNTWATGAGPNQMTWFDANHCGNFGFYGAPTLADLQAGPLTWATWPGNPTPGGAEATPFDYGAQPVKLVSFQTGSGWSAFEGYLDAITIALTTGESYVVDLESAADPLYVDGAWTGATVGTEVAPGRWMGWNAFAKVQDAVTAAIPGGTVNVAAGSYSEQVVVTGKSLTIAGAGRALTTIVSPVSLPTSFPTPGNSNFAVVLVQNASNVVVRDLTVDGAGRGNANVRFEGVAFWNAGGKLLDCDVKRIEDTPFSGAQHGVAVYVNSNTAGPYAFEMGGCNLTDFQKNGTVFAGSGLTVNAHDCTITGAGSTTVTAQNGVQAGGLVAATLTNVNVSGIYYAGPGWSASGVLIYDLPSLTVSGGSVTNAQVAWYVESTSGSITNGSVTGVSSAAGAWGFFVYNPSTSLAKASGTHAPPPAQPLDGPAAGKGTLATSYTLNVTGGCITGPGTLGTEGVLAYSEGGGLTMNVTGAEISGWEYGLDASGTGAVVMNATGDAITGNLTAGYYGATGLTHNATNDWWGNAGGPGVGGANPVVGPVTFAPWLVSGADLTPGCGFTPPPSTLTPGAPATCITPAHPCITIPVTITRATAEAMRAFSVDVTLSSNLTLCGTSFDLGSYLPGTTNLGFYASGPNTWTVDGTTLGLPCGATAPTGTLFNLYVSSTAPSGTGTVTLANPQLRDCVNGPLPAGVGGAVSFTIDNTAPAAVTALAAAQVTTGNDGDGTTKVRLTFTPPVDAALVKVYRAPFGNYPEYDDAPSAGAPPAAPGAYPPSGPWALTAVTASGQTDEPATRDWWYYVAYAQDACGNWSAASNVTGGTLDYHLGDVTNGVAWGAGNNVVDIGDVSLLGFHYGITLAPLDAWNFLDVGPTTTNYVNGRPLTDNKVNFEDLMMFAINYGVASSPAPGGRTVAGDANALAVEAPDAVEAGATFTARLVLHGVGDLQGLSAQLGWDGGVATPEKVEAGGLLADQNGLVLSPAPGGVDAAVLGSGTGMRGDGVLATVTFRALAAGAPRVRIATVEGRDAANRPLALGVLSAAGPVATQLAPVQPNPFRGATTIAWSLAKRGPASIAVFSVDGRRVRTLANGVHEAGAYRIRWDGTDDQGHGMHAGVYYVRMQTTEGVQRRSVVLVP